MTCDKSEAAPYLSVVVTTRNDNHGKNPLERLRICIDNMIQQFQAHQLDSEIIIVEWNPPADRPRLSELSIWPKQLEYCAIRIIEVPESLHRLREHADALPLFQMIAKNVGIRRAHGQFVLLTNIDILLSDELVQYIADRNLREGIIYRTDRYDCDNEVPADATSSERLSYAKSHLLRVHGGDGTFPLDHDGIPSLFAQDVVDAADQIRFGSGWYPAEKDQGQIQRWAKQEAVLLVKTGIVGDIEMHIEPSPWIREKTLSVRVTDSDGAVSWSGSLTGPARITCKRPSGDGEWAELRIQTDGEIDSQCTHWPGALETRQDIFFRVFREESAPSPVVSAPTQPLTLPRLLRRKIRSFPRWLRRQPYRIFRRLYRYLIYRGWINERSPLQYFPKECTRPLQLNTNASGDFQLMSKADWLNLRGYAEVEMYSMHLDTILQHVAVNAGLAEENLAPPLCTYHLEHETGSGWTPEGEQHLWERLDKAGIPYLEWEMVAILLVMMREWKSPLIFNGADWGLAGHELSEERIGNKKLQSR